MKQPNVAVYGSNSCPDTVKTKKLLDEKQIPFEFKDVDAQPEFNDYIAGLNNGKRVMPTLRINNETLINPSADELIKALDAVTNED